MATDGGSVLWVEQPLTTPQKRMAGSSKMAADGGSVICGGKPLIEVGSRAQHNRKDWNDLTRLLMTLILYTLSCIKANVPVNHERGNLSYFQDEVALLQSVSQGVGFQVVSVSTGKTC